MSLPDTAAVVGLGLMGGSLARELAARGTAVLGYDPDPRALEGAVGAGVLRGVLPPSLEGIEEAGLLVIAVPVTATAGVLGTALPRLRRDVVVTDLGSTKRAVEAAALEAGVGARFVGSHPLTGDHRSGWDASRQGLFVGARVVVCPTPRSESAPVERVREMWRSLGSVVETMSAEEHDRRVAWTSHLPQLASTALALALNAAGHPRGELGPGGRDVTRLAASSPEMWTAICEENGDLLEEAIRSLERELSTLRGALRRDPALVRERFTRARDWSAGG